MTASFAFFCKRAVAFIFCYSSFVFYRKMSYIPLQTPTSRIGFLIFFDVLAFKIMCFNSCVLFLCLAWTVCRPCGRSAGPVGRVSSSALQRILRFSQRQLCQRSQPAGAGAPKRYHCWQFTCFLHFPSRKCCKFTDLKYILQSPTTVRLPPHPHPPPRPINWRQVQLLFAAGA